MSAMPSVALIRRQENPAKSLCESFGFFVECGSESFYELRRKP